MKSHIYNVCYSYGRYSDKTSGEVCSFKNLTDAESFLQELKLIESNIRDVHNEFNEICDFSSQKSIIETVISLALTKIKFPKITNKLLDISQDPFNFIYREEIEYFIVGVDFYEDGSQTSAEDYIWI